MVSVNNITLMIAHTSSSPCDCFYKNTCNGENEDQTISHLPTYGLVDDNRTSVWQFEGLRRGWQGDTKLLNTH